MIRKTGTNRHRGFTLIELLVVVGMIALIVGSVTTSVSAAQNRARIQKATSDVHVIAQAILSYENHVDGDVNKIPEYADKEGVEADATTLGFLLGEKSSSEAPGQKIPALLMAALQGGKMRDPWGHPYKLRIVHRTGGSSSGRLGTVQCGYFLPNFFRLGEDDRDL